MLSSLRWSRSTEGGADDLVVWRRVPTASTSNTANSKAQAKQDHKRAGLEKTVEASSSKVGVLATPDAIVRHPIQKTCLAIQKSKEKLSILHVGKHRPPLYHMFFGMNFCSNILQNSMNYITGSGLN